MRIDDSIFVNAPVQSIFQLSQDYARRLEWDPFLREARILGLTPSPSVGVRSWCVTWFGVGMETEYISYEPPKVVAVKMTNGPWIFTQFAASWNFISQDEFSAVVKFTYSFQLQAPLRVLTPLVGFALRFEMARRLRSLKRVCEERN